MLRKRSPKRTAMSRKSIWSRRGSHLLLLITALLALVITAQAKGTDRKTTKVASRPHPVSNPDHDLLMRIEENQKILQRQLIILNATTEHNADQLNRRIDSLTEQLQRLVSATQKRSDPTEQLLTVFQSAWRLLRIVIGLLVVICGALLF